MRGATVVVLLGAVSSRVFADVGSVDPSAVIGELVLPLDHAPAHLPAAMLKLARDRAAQREQAPSWFKRLLGRHVGEYFPRATPERRTQLLTDVIRVFNQFEKDDRSGQFDGFVEAQLTPFVASLRATEIENPIRHGVAAQPVADWTLETLVVRRMIVHLTKFKDFGARTLGLVTGGHLKGATYAATTLISWAVLYHYFPAMTWTASAGVANLMGFVLTGPVNAVTTAAGGFFVRPTTELVKTLGSRLTGNLEAKINRGYDSLVERFFSSGDTAHNDSVRVATFEEEHTDFAGMRPEDQLKNWARGLNIFIMVQNIFGRLLRDTHHGGRDLMMLSWTDSQNVTQLVETLDVKEHVLVGLRMAILAPYRNALVNAHNMTAKDELDRRVKAFDREIEDVWLNPDADQSQIDARAARIDAAAERLREHGLGDDELRDLVNVQRQRGRAIGKLITAVAIGHLRSFYGAERNRNLARDAHHIAHAIQVGFGTEEYTERYLPLVRRQLRLMGLEYSDADPVSPLEDPVVIKREDCLMRALRRELGVPRAAKPETYACVNALIGFDAHGPLLADADSPSARTLRAFTSHGHRLEAGGVMKYALTLGTDPAATQRRIGAALASCQ